MSIAVSINTIISNSLTHLAVITEWRVFISKTSVTEESRKAKNIQELSKNIYLSIKKICCLKNSAENHMQSLLKTYLSLTI